MTQCSTGQWHCNNCNTSIINVKKPDLSVIVKQESKINDEGIWMPWEEYVPEGCASNYRLLISKEMFVEAYNKWIKNCTGGNNNEA
jgi:hypothetical protein